MRARALSPGRGKIVAILRCKGCRYAPQWSCTHRRRAWLYDLTAATPKRVPTLAQEWALDRAMAARQSCGKRGRRFYICLQAAVFRAPALSAKSNVHSSVPPKQRPASADPAPESISPTRASAAARATASSASSCAPAASPRNNWPKLSEDKIKRSPHSGRTSTRLSPPQDTPAEWRIG
ncbi:hypothetical protein ACFWBB_42340 [Streptomyces sp. NPDC060000]|uniref:hypothetical protein n=1 Tax=Streptomyces sp. NPDC060000 TaxID=3347031 RepID=UPI003674A8A3